jgi:uncharacterized peroxidase-related enzyme
MSHVLKEASASPLSRLPLVDEEISPDDIRSLLARHVRENWIRALSLNPDTARRFAGYFEHLFASTGRQLPIEERELIAVVVSSTNGCGLCEIHHTQALGEVLDDLPKARRIALDYHLAHLSPRERALADIAVKITQTPHDLDTSDFDRLRAHGLSEAAILEAVETASWFNHTNRIFISLGVVPDEKYFL